jgi:hypothetical protein
VGFVKTARREADTEKQVRNYVLEDNGTDTGKAILNLPGVVYLSAQ